MGRIRAYFRSNPGAIFIVAFECLLALTALETWSGNAQSADEVAVTGFIVAIIGVTLLTLNSKIEHFLGSKGKSAEEGT